MKQKFKFFRAMAPTITMMASRCVGNYTMTGSSGDNAGGDSKSCMLQWEGNQNNKLQKIDSVKITDSLRGKTVRCINGIAPVVPVQAVIAMEETVASLYESKYA